MKCEIGSEEKGESSCAENEKPKIVMNSPDSQSLLEDLKPALKADLYNCEHKSIKKEPEAHFEEPEMTENDKARLMLLKMANESSDASDSDGSQKDDMATSIRKRLVSDSSSNDSSDNSGSDETGSMISRISDISTLKNSDLLSGPSNLCTPSNSSHHSCDSFDSVVTELFPSSRKEKEQSAMPLPLEGADLNSRSTNSKKESDETLKSMLHNKDFRTKDIDKEISRLGNMPALLKRKNVLATNSSEDLEEAEESDGSPPKRSKITGKELNSSDFAETFEDGTDELQLSEGHNAVNDLKTLNEYAKESLLKDVSDSDIDSSDDFALQNGSGTKRKQNLDKRVKQQNDSSSSESDVTVETLNSTKKKKKVHHKIFFDPQFFPSDDSDELEPHSRRPYKKKKKHPGTDHDDVRKWLDRSGCFSSSEEKTSDSDSSVVKTKSHKQKSAESNITESQPPNEEKIIDTESSVVKTKSHKQKSAENKITESLPPNEEKIKVTPESKNVSDGKDGAEIQELPNLLPGSQSFRRNIRKVISDKDLQDETKLAALAERKRRKRVAERQKLYNLVTEVDADKGETITKECVLEVDPVTKEELIKIHPELVVKLKAHQVQGIKFMWECTFESVKQLNENSTGSGCILAHCMGLGKTLQTIVFLHTVLNNKYTKEKIRTALIICPFTTVLNWEKEFDIWLNKDELRLNVTEMASIRDDSYRAHKLQEWQKEGGVMIIGYETFRTLVQKEGQYQDVFSSALLKPGPDIVVCDEGHVLKNAKKRLSLIVNQITTKRRIVLTGTPLQNNLEEYHCMVSFVKANLLGTKEEFRNRFMNPIRNGMCSDSTPADVMFMKKRGHILHKLLEGCVQRYDFSELRATLPPKFEFVLIISMSTSQRDLYQGFIDKIKQMRRPVADYHVFMKIWTHPYMLYVHHKNKKKAASKDGEVPELINKNTFPQLFAADPSEAGPSTNKEFGNGVTVMEDAQKTAPCENMEGGNVQQESDSQNQWWSPHVSKDDYSNLEMSGKMVLLIAIIKKCESIGDKLLIFSQSIYTLNFIEECLPHTNDKTADDSDQDHITTWVKGEDYFRIDGNISADMRKQYIEQFNDEKNDRARLFLISTKAGSLGINLCGANRVIVMDASWNPSHDVQAISRVYRYGQKKPVYVYRFVAQGAMEKTIYERQVVKQSLSRRVVDEHETKRHYTEAEISELYLFQFEVEKRPTPAVPKDRLLADLLVEYPNWILKYHEHDSLLQKIPEEDLTEEERQTAWAEYHNERELEKQLANSGVDPNNLTGPVNLTAPLAAQANFGRSKFLVKNKTNVFNIASAAAAQLSSAVHSMQVTNTNIQVPGSSSDNTHNINQQVQRNTTQRQGFPCYFPSRNSVILQRAAPNTYSLLQRSQYVPQKPASNPYSHLNRTQYIHQGPAFTAPIPNQAQRPYLSPNVRPPTLQQTLSTNEIPQLPRIGENELLQK